MPAIVPTRTDTRGNYIKVSFAAPATVLDFLSFLYRITFINEWVTNRLTMDGFYRVDMFSVAAPVGSWEVLFQRMKRLDPVYFNDRIGLLVFAVFLQVRKFDPVLEGIEGVPDFVNENDPILIKRGLFEVESGKIISVEKSEVVFLTEA